MIERWFTRYSINTKTRHDQVRIAYSVDTERSHKPSLYSTTWARSSAAGMYERLGRLSLDRSVLYTSTSIALRILRLCDLPT